MVKYVSDSGKKLKTTKVFLSTERGASQRRGFVLQGHWRKESVLKFCKSKKLPTEFLEIKYFIGYKIFD